MSFDTSSNRIKEKLEKKNVKTYLFFIAFTAFLWLALQFSKNHSQEVTFDIEYFEIEIDKIVKPTSDTSLKMILEGNGFQLVKYSLFKKTIYLDARKAKIDTENHTFFTGKPMVNAIKSALSYSGEISYVFKDSLHINYDVFEEKQVPLKLVTEIKYAPGFTSVKGIETEDKTIKVIGPKSIMDTLSNVNTEKLTLKDVQKDFERKLTINKSGDLSSLNFEKNEITVNLKVDKLTEGEFKIPITLLNTPENAKVQLLPKKVNVVFIALINDLSKLKASDFKVTADVSNASENSNKLLLKLEDFPNNVLSARLTEKEVQYIIIK